MAQNFSTQLALLFEQVQTPPDTPGGPRPYRTGELRDEIVRMTVGGEKVISESRLRQLREGKQPNPTIDVVAQISSAFAELARRSNPESPFASTDAVIQFLTQPEGEQVGIMARYWNLPEDNRAAFVTKFEAFLQEEEAKVQKRGLLGRRRK